MTQLFKALFVGLLLRLVMLAVGIAIAIALRAFELYTCNNYNRTHHH